MANEIALCVLCGRPAHSHAFLAAVLWRLDERERWREKYQDLDPAALCAKCLIEARKLTRRTVP